MMNRPLLKVLIAAPRGFCAGVDRAIQIVEIALDDEAQKNFTVSVDAVKELLVACTAIDGSLAK